MTERRQYMDRSTRELVTLGPEFRLVYQGGHHNVFCDGAKHYRTAGGWVGINDTGKGHGWTACDCKRYK